MFRERNIKFAKFIIGETRYSFLDLCKILCSFYIFVTYVKPPISLIKTRDNFCRTITQNCFHEFHWNCEQMYIKANRRTLLYRDLKPLKLKKKHFQTS